MVDELEVPTDFEVLYESVLKGDTVAALAASDICEEEGDEVCAVALRAFAGEIECRGHRIIVNLVFNRDAEGDPTTVQSVHVRVFENRKYLRKYMNNFFAFFGDPVHRGLTWIKGVIGRIS